MKGEPLSQEDIELLLYTRVRPAGLVGLKSGPVGFECTNQAPCVPSSVEELAKIGD